MKRPKAASGKPTTKAPLLPFPPDDARSFLTELASSLDLKATLLKLNITMEEAKSLFSAFLRNASRIEASRQATGGQATLASADGVIDIYVDGASRGNPGLAGAGAVFKDSDGKVLKSYTRYLGVVTNNVAEYEALILALEEATPFADSVRVFADSELMVKQIKGIYRVKNEGLKGLYAIAVKLIEGFSSFEISHVRREFNSDADKLANEAIDTRDA